MFRIVYSGGAMPASFPLDPSAQFQAGAIGELAVIGNQVLCTVSNGTAPLGIIDDYRTRAFTNISWNEEVIAPVTGVLNSSTGQLVTPVELQVPLKHPYILSSSFTSTVNCSLNSTNGIVAFIAGTPLNIDLDGDGTPDAIRAIVNYTYQVNNIPGDDSTSGSGRVTIWYERIIFETDQYETNQQYAVKSNLFVSEVGLLTTRQPSKLHPAVGMVMIPPTSKSNRLQALWY
jgi:hypothetical protein